MKKICPFMSRAYPVTAGIAGVTNYCIEDECALWVDESQEVEETFYEEQAFTATRIINIPTWCSVHTVTAV